MVAALKITAAGMGLVFLVILLLWLVIWLLVRIAPERGEDSEMVRKRQAAAAAVTAALADQAGHEALHEFPLPPTSIVSAWQAVMRSKMLNKRGSVR